MLDLLRGEDLDALSRQLGVKAATLAGGMTVADGEKLEATVKRLVEQLGKDQPQLANLIKLNAAKYEGVDLHVLTLPVEAMSQGDEGKKEKLTQVFGEKVQVVIGTGPNAAYIAAGSSPVDFLKSLMDKGTFYKIRDEIQRRIKAEFEIGSFEEMAVDFHAKDTICGQVSGRDKKLREFARLHDIMIFVAGRNSSNGKVLFHICEEANPRTYFVETESELLPQWFEGVESVGISGATSTPQWLMERVKLKIEHDYAPSVSA